MKRSFKVKLITVVHIPFDDALIEGSINENHIMYLAMAKQLEYNIKVRDFEIDYIDYNGEVIPVTARNPVNGVTLFDKESNIIKIWNNSTGKKY